MEDAPLPNENTIILKSDKNKTYKIKFTAKDNYLLIQSMKESKENIIYESKIQLSDIKLNKYFSICDSIYDVLLSLKPNLSNNIKLEEINNELKLIIPLNHPLAKEIIFNLKLQQNNNSNDLIQDLLNKMTSLSEKVELQQKEIDSLKKRVNALENERHNNNQVIEEKPFKINNTPKNMNNNMNNNQNNINKENNNSYSQPKIYHFSQKECSYIIRKKEEELSIKNWINSFKQIRFNLLFRMSRDGTATINFHTRCDNKGKTLVLIETKDGNRFGGYTSLQWNMEGEKRYGENIWLFNLEKNINKYILMKQSKSPAIICDMNNGPSFEEGIIFKNNDLSVGYIEHQGLINGAGIIDKKIQVKELEVFQVNIRY